MQCDVTRCIICLSNKVEYLDKEHSYKILPKKLYSFVNLSDLCNVIEKILDTILCHKHFKSG